jgi:hypothetical protein
MVQMIIAVRIDRMGRERQSARPPLDGSSTAQPSYSPAMSMK